MNSKIVYIAGSGRSETTWLMNIISNAYNFREIFEPIHPVENPISAGLEYKYLREHNICPEANLFFDKVISGDMWRGWVNQNYKFNLTCAYRYFKSLKMKYFNDGIVIKDIRSSLMLPWITKNYNCKIIYLIRHPCADVNSRLKIGWSKISNVDLEIFMNQSNLLKDYLGKYINIIGNLKDEVDIYAAYWCLENIIPLLNYRKYN